jgi:dipeptidyl aminopeptidase/acylaminoacyl peptidase
MWEGGRVRRWVRLWVRRWDRLWVCVLVGGIALASCSSTGGEEGSGPSTTAARSTTTTSAPLRTYAVGKRELVVIDPTRGTDAAPRRDMPATPDRTIEVLLLYPAPGEPGATRATPDAPVADGRFPLVVFSHGNSASGPAYGDRVRSWVAAGYVVALPTFPLTSNRPSVIGDYVNQPGDVVAVIDHLLGKDPVSEHLVPDVVGIAGHSLGAITSLGLAYNTCCSGDERIAAVIELSGRQLPFPDGTFDDPPPVPLLAVHGAKDSTVPISGSDEVVEEATGPALYLRFPDGGHVDILVGDSGRAVDAAAIAFLDAYLKDDDRRLEELPDLIEATDLATFAGSEDG